MRPGLQMDQIVNKQITLNVHTSESYITYFIMRQQIELFLKLGSDAKMDSLFMGPVSISLLSDGGFETVSYTFRNLTPVSLSDLSFSYAARLGNFTTYSVTFQYNYYDVYVSSGENYGDRTRVSQQIDPMYDFEQRNIQHTESDHRPGKPLTTVSTDYNTNRNIREMHSLSKGGPALISTQLKK